MKTKTLTRVLSLLLCLLSLSLCFSLVACKLIEPAPADTAAPAGTEADTAPETNADGMLIRGTGAVSFYLTVTDIDETAKTYEIRTNETKLDKALTALGLVSGEESAYGLYIKVVDGITADYDVDQTYWSLLVNGEMSMVGASSVDVVAGLRVELKKTK